MGTEEKPNVVERAGERDSPVETRRKVLRQLRVGETFRSSMSCEIDEEVELEYGRRVHSLEAFVLAEKLAADRYSEFVEFRTPKTTWQMFKHMHATSRWFVWFVRRRPVEFKKTHIELMVEVKRYVSYPEADVAIHNLGRPVIWEHVTTDLSRSE